MPQFPLKTLVVVHTDAEFLDDMNGELAEYVCSELNVRSLETCADPTKYATLRAEPDWQALGRRLGKQMGAVAAAVKAMGASDIAAYEAAGGNAVVGGVELGPGDVKVRCMEVWVDGRGRFTRETMRHERQHGCHDVTIALRTFYLSIALSPQRRCLCSNLTVEHLHW
eukprot:362190-Chlamydomonas_euryale.AAC.2